MENAALPFKAFRNTVHNVPMIIVENIDPQKINNAQLRNFFVPYNAKKCRVVWRNQKCLHIAAIEFDYQAEADKVLDELPSATICDIPVTTRAATQKDRELFVKKKKNPAAIPGGEVTSAVPSISPFLLVNDTPTTPISPIVSPRDELPQPVTIEEKNLPGNHLQKFDLEQLLNLQFVIIAVERSVNVTETPNGDLAFPYEFSLIKFSLYQIHATTNLNSFHRLISVQDLPYALIPSTLWCIKNLGSPDLKFAGGEKDLGKLFTEMNSFIMGPTTDPICLLAKNPHSVNSALYWLASKSNTLPGINESWIPPFGYAIPIEDLISKLYAVTGCSLPSSQIHEFFNPISVEHLRGLRCSYHEANGDGQARCAVATSKALVTICRNTINNTKFFNRI